MRIGVLFGGLAVAAALALGACPKGDDGGDSSVSPRVTAEERAEAGEAALQGRWQVELDGKIIYRVNISGDHAQIIDQRFAKAKTYEGSLGVGPTAFTVGDAAKMAYRYGWAKTSAGLHLGAGEVYAVADLGAFSIKLTPFASLSRSRSGSGGSDGCIWRKTMGGVVDEREMRCSDAPDPAHAGRRVLRFELPDAFDQTELTERSMVFVDGLLMSPDVANSVARRVQ